MIRSESLKKPRGGKSIENGLCRKRRPKEIGGRRKLRALEQHRRTARDLRFADGKQLPQGRIRQC
jgi:hypothetical protein